MRYHKLKEIEYKFETTLNASGKQMKETKAICPFAKGIAPANQAKPYFITPNPMPEKKKIYIHGTVGILPGDAKTLTDSTVSVAYLIARSGTIYELFDPSLAAYHLGPGSGYSNSGESFGSVAIELSTLGALKLKDNKLVDIYGQDYCSLSDTDAYVKKTFRDYDYYATLTNPQIDATNQLIDWISQHFNFVPSMVPHRNLDVNLIKKYNVLFHSNVRADKVDIPDFIFY